MEKDRGPRFVSTKPHPGIQEFRKNEKGRKGEETSLLRERRVLEKYGAINLSLWEDGGPGEKRAGVHRTSRGPGKDGAKNRTCLRGTHNIRGKGKVHTKTFDLARTWSKEETSEAKEALG